MKFSIKTLKLAVTAIALPAIGLAIALTLPAPLNGATAEGGEANYKAKCVMCHGADGSGKTPMGQKLNLRDLRSPEVQKLSDAEMGTIIAKGKGKMPANAAFTPDQVKQLVAYTRELAKKK